MESNCPNRKVRFGSIEIDLESGELRKKGLKIRLQEQPFQLLQMLLERPGHVVTREALRQRLWPGQTFVDFDQGLNRAVNKLREALGDSADRPRYIETLPKRGYRIIAPVREVNTLETPEVSPTLEVANGSRARHANNALRPPISRRVEKGSKTTLVKIIAATGLLVVVAFLAMLDLTHSKNTATSFERMEFRRLTTNGQIRAAAISPFGKYLAYAKEKGGLQSLWVRRMATQSDVQIVPPADCDYGGLTFSKDGNLVYCVRYEKPSPQGVLYEVPVSGGQPQRLCDAVESPVTISPDGKRMAFVSRNAGRRDHTLIPGRGGDALVIMNTQTRSEDTIATRKLPDFFSIEGPAWSPDGQWIATAEGSYTGNFSRRLVAVGVNGSRVKDISHLRWWHIGQVEWKPDGTALVMSASDKPALGNFQIWEVTYPGGTAHRITNDLNDYDDVSLTADSRSLVTLQHQELSELDVLPKGGTRRPRRITAGRETHDGVYGMCWTPDDRIVYSSDATGNLNLWITGPSSSAPRQLTKGPQVDAWPSVCPDGRHIMFVSFRTGSPNIWRANLDGSSPIQLTHGDSDFAPVCSPDGKWVVYESSQSGLQTIYKVPIDGGIPVRLVEKPSYDPVISPDGKLVACIYHEEPDRPSKIAVIPFGGGSAIRMLEIPSSARLEDGEAGMHWTSDGRALAYVDERQGTFNVWAEPLTGGAPRQLTYFDSNQIFFFAWSRDGEKLALSRGNASADAIMISNFR